MNVRSGFVLIDLVIGLLIASLLSITLYRLFSQTMRIATVSSHLIEDYSDVLIMSNQLERDLSSVVVLKEHEKFALEEEKGAEASPEKSSAIDLAEEKKKEDADEKKEERLAFAGIIKDNKLSTLSFVCTNALPQFDMGGSRLVRVRYFLTSDPQVPNLSVLMREERSYQQSQERTASDVAHPYVILPHIESMTMKFYGTLYVPSGARQSESKEHETIALSSWGNEEQRKKIKRLVPEYVEIIGMCRSATGDEAPFSILIPIPAGIAAGIEGREQERREAEKAAQKSAGAP